MDEDLEKSAKKMAREIKLLNKKLTRSEANRAQAEKMKDETDALYENVLQQVADQKQVIEEAQVSLQDAFNVISSSINYAARIQRSMLPNYSLLDALVQDHLILWDPRDTVGGDIYWVGAWGDGCLIMLGDCTGHGVPGAFMSLITIGALERAMSEVSGGELGLLISRLHQYIQTALGQHYEGGDSDDGLELGAVYFAPDGGFLTFAGARFDLFEINSGTVNVTKGIKCGLGYRKIPYTQAYEEKVVPLSTGSSFYLTTDGIIDQIGGVKHRSFGKKRFLECLLLKQDHSMAEQKQHLEETLLNYQGKERRRDDVSVIGLRF
jgi:serine phosphatase RsbU (regulator of sigma subunit)